MKTAFEILKDKKSARIDDTGYYIEIDCTDGDELIINEKASNSIVPNPFEETMGFDKPVQYKCDITFDETNRATDFLPEGVLVIGDVRIYDCKSNIKLRKGRITGELEIYNKNSIELSDFTVSSISFKGEGKLKIKNKEKKEFELLELENNSISLSNSNVKDMIVGRSGRDISSFEVSDSEISSLGFNPSITIRYFSLFNSKIRHFNSDRVPDVKSMSSPVDFPKGLKDSESKFKFHKLYYKAFSNMDKRNPSNSHKFKYFLTKDLYYLQEGNLTKKVNAILNLLLRGTWGYGCQISVLLLVGLCIMGSFGIGHFLVTTPNINSIELTLPYLYNSLFWTLESFIPTAPVNERYRLFSIFGKLIGLFFLTMIFAYAKEEIR